MSLLKDFVNFVWNGFETPKPIRKFVLKPDQDDSRDFHSDELLLSLKLDTAPEPASGSIRLGLNCGRAFSPFKMAISSFNPPISSACRCTVSLSSSMIFSKASTQGVCSPVGALGKGGSFFMGY